MKRLLTKECLFCAERIKAEAKLCRYCGKSQVLMPKYIKVAILVFLLLFITLGFVSSNKQLVMGTVGKLKDCSEMNAVNLVKPYVIRVENKTPHGTMIGTGFISQEGFIVTSSHVVDQKGELTVFPLENTKSSAQIVSNDPVKDVAILKAPGIISKALSWGDSDHLNVPETVIAIGYALDLPGEPTVTKGSFSAARVADGLKYIQTDTPLNSGNSGGPLLNTCGEVIGVNTLSTNDAQQVNFSISSNQVVTIISDLLQNKKVVYTDTNDVFTDAIADSPQTLQSSTAEKSSAVQSKKARASSQADSPSQAVSPSNSTSAPASTNAPSKKIETSSPDSSQSQNNTPQQTQPETKQPTLIESVAPALVNALPKL